MAIKPEPEAVRSGAGRIEEQNKSAFVLSLF
jgi:hypothetical protein